MPYSDLSFRALSALHKSRYLFSKHGFHNVGVDRLVSEAEVPKASFYNYFHSKQRLIEMCLSFQKDALKEQVISIIYIQKDLALREKLKKIFFLHTNLVGNYYLLFRAIFEIEKLYPKAYQVVVEYRNWLINEIYILLLNTIPNASKKDAYMFLFVIDGAMVQLLGDNSVDDRDVLLEYVLKSIAVD
ncbi:TetR/AcrR family transcriptional regulator [Acinetobacter calcoaceticus]|uniref:TetR/AcrR family transcriptional regulator n=1 Tax=Acinetobacter calcoaceticus TaxID=471 RepID=UPI0019013367|nr:TetR/AcrR family transcriptional regulator [Acinetobacter calcoaceticus]MBJ9721943.1 TetR/AcrR family transcriptional regulator [Acinetobacter calcoaceticus]